jgi:hypothetical protein
MSSLGGSETSYQDMNKITTLFVTATVVTQHFVVTVQGSLRDPRDQCCCATEGSLAV